MNPMIMSGQQIVAYLIVCVAAAYLARNFVRALRAFWSNKGGCSSGCGKCGLASQIAKRKAAVAKTRPDIIPLTEIRPLPPKREN